MSTMITGRENIAMFGLLQLRHRLHLEIKTGMRMSKGPSTIAIMKHKGITSSSNKWYALCDLNEAIKEAGGPPDKQSLEIQKFLALAGKPSAYPK